MVVNPHHLWLSKHDNNWTRLLATRWVAKGHMSLHSLAGAITDFLAHRIRISEILL